MLMKCVSVEFGGAIRTEATLAIKLRGGDRLALAGVFMPRPPFSLHRHIHPHAEAA